MTECLRCPVCATSDVECFYRMADVPVQQNAPGVTPEEARNVRRGALAFHVCLRCGFVYNAAFEPSLMRYGQDYDNTQDVSEAFRTYTASLVTRILANRTVSGTTVVEVGCGKGAFLLQLIESAGGCLRGVGFDPSYQGPASALQGRVRFERRYFDERVVGLAADMVVCRHVIEHIPNPLDLLRNMRAAQGGNTTAPLFLETPSVEWILQHGVVWDLFYEHCSLFSQDSLRLALALSGFEVAAVDAVFGGQYLWCEATPAPPAQYPCDGREVVAAVREFAKRASQQVEGWRQMVEQLASLGPISVWGAGAKGVTFVNLIDAQGHLIDSVVDINPKKQGKFTPGTGHAIIAPSALVTHGIKAVVVLNPCYISEIQCTVQGMGLDVKVVDLMGT